MADEIKITNLPDSGSVERVAFELLQTIRAKNGYFGDEKSVLDTYARCLDAAKGLRENYQ